MLQLVVVPHPCSLGRCVGSRQGWCLQLGSEARAGQCQPCSVLRLLPHWGGRAGTVPGSCSCPSWPGAIGAHLTQLLPRAASGSRPGRSDTATDGGERVQRGTGSAPRWRQKREVPKPSAVENNQVARWEAAGG